MNAVVMNYPSHAMRAEAPAAPLRIAPWVAGTAVWVLMLVGGWCFMNAGQSRDIASLRVDGPLKHVSAQAVQAAVRPRLDEGFVEMRLEDVKADVERLPWVARARVERLWPAGVRVRVWEREVYSRWGAASLLDTEGHVFTPKAEELPGDLPRLAGEPGHEQEVKDTYERLAEELKNSPFALAGLALDARGEWTAQTRAGIGLHLGSGDLEQKISMLQDTAVPTLEARMNDVDYVDLRYTNGFSVGWKTPEKGATTVAATGETHG